MSGSFMSSSTNRTERILCKGDVPKCEYKLKRAVGMESYNISTIQACPKSTLIKTTRTQIDDSFKRVTMLFGGTRYYRGVTKKFKLYHSST
jgi:hypothetical protein